MEIVLIRHGEPEWVVDGLNIDNPPLTARGHAQARAMAEFLCDRQTAAPLFELLNREESVQPWLEEIRNPLWHGTPQERADEAYRQDRARKSHERWDGLEGGEPPREFVERIHIGSTAFLSEQGVTRVDAELSMWNIADPERKIALVAHAGTNSVFICHVLGIPPTPWEWDRFVIGHATVSRLESMQMGDGHSFSLSALSDDEYLPRVDRTR
jgi:probable phosphoglycerate mutase